ncbi:MAG: DUF4340 domain-containing protein [Ruminococcus flavefaciens]|nr:DUF4340 domain-containing protein [Ruminococcus flavefaciens]MCM1228945.1 DUF4340 domain-containing protein [Ruminococcus flavefaciens]
MKKSVKGIIGLCAVLAVLGGGYTALMLTQPEEPAEDNSSSDVTDTQQHEVILIHDDSVTGTDPDTGADLKGVVKTVDVKNASGELHVVQKTPATDDTATVYTLDGYQDVAMKTSVIGTLANNANGMTSADIIEENCTNLAKFGLDSPEITVDIEYETGTKYRLLIGNSAPTGSVTYVMLDGIDTVFTVKDSTLANYSKTFTELVDTTILKSPDETPIVESFRIEREDIDYDILLEYIDDDSDYKGGTSSAHMMKEPVEAYLAAESSSDVITGMFGLSADGIYCVHCEESDIAEAGLASPFCTVSMECSDGNDYKLLLSEPFNDSENGRSCYAMLEGGNVIFIITTEKAMWTTIKPVDVASTMYVASYVWNITDLKFSADGKEYSFEISPADPANVPESPKASDFNVTLNGEDFDSERYRQFYSFLISGNAEDFAFEEELPSGEPMAELEYTDSYDNRTRTYAFYDYSAMTAVIAVDGQSKFFISKPYVETLIDNAERLDSDEDFVKTWR